MCWPDWILLTRPGLHSTDHPSPQMALFTDKHSRPRAGVLRHSIPTQFSPCVPLLRTLSRCEGLPGNTWEGLRGKAGVEVLDSLGIEVDMAIDRVWVGILLMES